MRCIKSLTRASMGCEGSVYTGFVSADDTGKTNSKAITVAIKYFFNKSMIYFFIFETTPAGMPLATRQQELL